MTEAGLTSENFELSNEQEDTDGLTVTGLALPFDEESRNGVVYDKESIRENADSMIGTPVLFNHDEDTVVGHVQNVWIEEEGLHYEMDLDPEHEVIRQVERGDISNVSIQAIVDRETGDSNVVEVEEFLELSIVSVPGFPQTGMSLDSESGLPEGVVAVESLVTEQEEDGVELDEEPDDFDDMGDCVSYHIDKGMDREQAVAVCLDMMDGDAEHLKLEETFTPPEPVAEEAQAALDARDNDEFDNDECGTDTGWARANQLAGREPVSEETVQRMRSFFARHDGNQDVDEGDVKEEDCGWLMWKAWGGDTGREWVEDINIDGDSEMTDEEEQENVQEEPVEEEEVEESAESEEQVEPEEDIDAESDEEADMPEEEPDDGEDDEEEELGLEEDVAPFLAEKWDVSVDEAVEFVETVDSEQVTEFLAEPEEDATQTDDEETEDEVLDDEPVDEVAEQMVDGDDDVTFKDSVPRLG